VSSSGLKLNLLCANTRNLDSEELSAKKKEKRKKSKSPSIIFSEQMIELPCEWKRELMDLGLSLSTNPLHNSGHAPPL
jgi:hypothetical protein